MAVVIPTGNDIPPLSWSSPFVVIKGMGAGCGVYTLHDNVADNRNKKPICILCFIPGKEIVKRIKLFIS